MPLAELRAYPGGKLDRLERKRNYVVGAEIQPASALERVAGHDHHDFEWRFGLGARLELRDHPAAAQVRRRRFGDQHFGSKSQHLIDGKPTFLRDLIALSCQGSLRGLQRVSTEIKKQDAHQVFDADRY